MLLTCPMNLNEPKSYQILIQAANLIALLENYT